MEPKLTQNYLKEKVSELEQEAKFRSYVDNAPDGVFVTNKKAEYIEVNRAVCEMTGYTEKELLNLSIPDLIEPNDIKKAMDGFQEMSQKGSTQRETGYLTKTGEHRFWDVAAVKITDTRYLGFAKDITQRKKAEQALKENEETLRNIIENSTNLFYSHTPDHSLTYLSPQVKDILGYSEEEAMTNWTEFVSDNPINEIGFKNTVKAIQTGERQPVYELELVRKDGRKIWVEVREAPLLENGNVISIVGSLNDITEKKQAEETLRQAQKMKSIGTLAGGIAHEFNNMLGIIIGNTELALDDIPEWNPAADCIQEIRTASLRAKDVVRKLLSVARKTLKSRKPVQIRSIVDETLGLLRKTMPANIEIRSNLACTTEMILADPTEISQVLMNLCTNSEHAMVDGEGVLEVTLETKTLNSRSSAYFKDIAPRRLCIPHCIR